MFNARTITIGKCLECDVYDEHGVLLLATGSPVTDTLIRRVRFRDLRFGSPDAKPQPVQVVDGSKRKSLIEIEPPRRFMPADCDLHTATTTQLDKLVEEVTSAPDGFDPPPPSRRPAAPSQLTLSRLREQVETGREHYREAVEHYADLADDIRNDRTPDLTGASVMLNHFFQQVRMDASLAMLVMDLQSSPSEYLYQHGMNVALLSMRTAMQLGYDRQRVMQTALAALLADVGMLTIPESVRFAPRALTEDERAEVARHPIYTIERLGQTGALDATGLMIAYQVHERADESGYPRGRSGQTIHPLARVVSAADTYCAITCNRPYRDGKPPFVGMATLLSEVRGGRLDAMTVRAILASTSLFPVGSYVQLADGTSARVLRANPTEPRRPIVLPLHYDGSETTDELNLAIRGTPQISAILSEADIRRAGERDNADAA